ncbi:MAG: hypothetical protein K0U72_03450 [Gammaproteobacteria bacterium]|nr:hypothetical protein [Gammaproteobacteria bacterium]
MAKESRELLQDDAVSGEFIDIGNERYYAIRNVDRMAPFFVSVISGVDHWLFVSSTGGLTAGRVSPATALFPYITVDKIHESSAHTGSKTLLRVSSGKAMEHWEPFRSEKSPRFSLTRNIYKNVLGNKLCFEEINHDLGIAFRYTWMTSDSHGFVRRCELENLASATVKIDLLDGLQNVLPAGTPAFTQRNSSNLVDAYKWTELDEQTGLALFTLYSGITDRAEPSESLKANVVYCLGLEGQKTLISSEQINDFRLDAIPQQEVHKRGIRGAYLVSKSLELTARTKQEWQIVADIEKTQSDVVALRHQLSQPNTVSKLIDRSVNCGTEELARIMASSDGFQTTAEENVSVHHYANVLFNVLRGGIFDDQYTVTARDFCNTIKGFNSAVYERNHELLHSLPERVNAADLLATIHENDDRQLERLCYDYLPITFGRRHGDPSRPWNDFAIRLKDDNGDRLLSYEGNWRDIFQNWEALTFSYPDFVENIIAKFVNASTVEGYNPYRITKEGIDWEVEEPDNPWSYIGYWGDHQIIYLQKLLEQSQEFHPSKLSELLYEPIFCYANVPYRIRPFSALLQNPKSTVDFDDALADRIERRLETIGADGKLVLDGNGEVYQVNLIEKLLVALLAKLGNLVIDGGIWLNTQRPEWNDANNALVGQGLSMVTLYYMRRYVTFLQRLLVRESRAVELSDEVGEWLSDTAAALSKVRSSLGGDPISPQLRFQTLTDLGLAASRYRERVYKQESFTGKSTRPLQDIAALLDDALAAIDHSIGTNKREDGLYHAYNLLDLGNDSIEIESLYPMLEGQVAALSAGAIEGAEAASVVEALFESEVYRSDQRSFMLYPDRRLPGFLDKNHISATEIDSIPLLKTMLTNNDDRIVVQDADGVFRFNADFSNVAELAGELQQLADEYGDEVKAAQEPLSALYENVFNHQAFTGRSGGMFGFEGLGCIYWHMVSKLLLAIQENFFAACEHRDDSATIQRLGDLYYRVRQGIGFNKTPSEYGAFPTDPYSHTPRHAGARQPGMTGQAKEEVLTRFGELGVRIVDGAIRFVPALLREREFVASTAPFRYLDIDRRWQDLAVPAGGLAFSWCQVPIVYAIGENSDSRITLTFDDDSKKSFSQLALPANESASLFARNGHIRHISVTLGKKQLFTG